MLDSVCGEWLSVFCDRQAAQLDVAAQGKGQDWTGTGRGIMAVERELSLL